MNYKFQEAIWIWAGGALQKNQYIRFLNEFYLDGPTGTAELFISVDSNYAVWINGSFVNCGQYADFPDYKVYDSLDVSSCLKSGKNTIAIEGYFNGEESSVYYKGAPGLLYELTKDGRVLAKSDQNNRCSVDHAYQNGEVEKITPQLGYTYHYDAKRDDGWTRDGYIPGEEWKQAVPVCKAKELFERPVQKLKIQKPVCAQICAQGVFLENRNFSNETTGKKMQRAYLDFRPFSELTESAQQSLPSEKGVAFQAPEGDGVFIVIDMEKEKAGFLRLLLETEAPAGVDIGFGEHLSDMRVRTYVGGRNFAVTFHTKSGMNEFTGYFKRLGCRYLQLHVHALKFTLFYAGILPTTYPVEALPFKISDRLHQKIYETCVDTMKLCMHEHYEDCPWREQALYTMDSRTQMLLGYYAFGEYQFARASLKLFSFNKRDDNLLSLCAPSDIYITIPSFNLMYFLEVYEYVLYSGDRSLGAEVFEYCAALLKQFIGKMKDNGLIPNFTNRQYWNFYEWADGLEGAILPEHDIPETFDAPLNALFSIALDRFGKLCKILGKADDALYYKDLSVKVNKSIHQCFWNDEKLSYATYVKGSKKYHYAQLTQALAVYCGACPEDNKDAVLEKLFDNRYVPITLSYCIFKYDALLQNRPEKYGERVFNEIADKWGSMLFQGAQTFWETEKGQSDFDNAGSLCHGWSAVPLYVYYAYGLGARPSENRIGAWDFKPASAGIHNITAIMQMAAQKMRLELRDGKCEIFR